MRGGARLRILLLTLALLATSASAFTMVDSGFEITQIRNGLIATAGQTNDFVWTPEHPPPTFLNENVSPPSEFREAVRRAVDGLSADASAWDKTLALARDLSRAPKRLGDGIKSSTRETYRLIVSAGRGYCADYTQVMNGLAYTAGIPVREWGMSFEDYSGNGHAFNEIYDASLSRWILIDSYYSLYFVARDSGTPLSALELRERLAAGEGTETISVRPILAKRFTFPSERHAIEYYRQGTDQFFMYLGNNVFSYDANILVSWLSPHSRALEETAGIVLGIRPRIRLLVTDTNRPAMGRLFFRRNLFLSLAAISCLLVGLLAFQLRGLRRRK